MERECKASQRIKNEVIGMLLLKTTMDKLKIHLLFLIPTVFIYGIIQYMVGTDAVIIIGISEILSIMGVNECFRKKDS